MINTELCIKYVESDLESLEWDAFVASCPNAVYAHSRSYLKLIASQYNLKYKLLYASKPDGTWVAALPFVFKPSLFGINTDKAISVPFSNSAGVVTHSHSSISTYNQLFVDYLNLHGISEIEIRFVNPNSTSDECLYFLELSTSEEIIWRSFKDKVRNQIRKANKFHLYTKSGKDQLDPFYRLYSSLMKKHGTPAHSQKFFERFFSSDIDCEILTVYKDNDPLASMFILKMKENWTILYAAATDASRPYNANMFMYWSAMQKAIKSGCKIFDFGRSNVKSGTCHFKRQWGAYPVPVSNKRFIDGTVKEGSNVDTYRTKKLLFISNLWKHIPLNILRLVAPRVRRYLP